MDELNHKERAHALLSASGAKRWIACPPSARLEETFPEVDTEFSKEGTRAHELAERALRTWLETGNDPLFLDYYQEPEGTFSHEDVRIYAEVRPYIEYVQEEYLNAKAIHGLAILLLEQRLDYSEYAQDGFGTGDAILLYAGTIEVIDLKFGKGVAVYADENAQLRLYGLGALGTFGAIYDPDIVKMTIHQPRLDHVTSEELSADALTQWARTEVMPRAKLAYLGEGKYNPGEHCRFCKAAATCRARAEEILDLAKMDFKSPDTLSNDEIAEVLIKVDRVSSWVNAVKDYALDQALGGATFNGFKVVEGRSMRVYKDADQVAFRVLASGVDEALIYERKLVTLTAMEKILGKKKFPELLGDLIIKPAGKPALVSEDDPRPAFSPASADFKDVEVE